MMRFGHLGETLFVVFRFMFFDEIRTVFRLSQTRFC